MIVKRNQSLKDEYAAQSTPPRFINRPSDVKIAQVQDEFYGNVGTYNSILITGTKHLSEGRDINIYTLLITKIESCRYESSTMENRWFESALGHNKSVGMSVIPLPDPKTYGHAL